MIARRSNWPKGFLPYLLWRLFKTIPLLYAYFGCRFERVPFACLPYDTLDIRACCWRLISYMIHGCQSLTMTWYNTVPLVIYLVADNKDVVQSNCSIQEPSFQWTVTEPRTNAQSDYSGGNIEAYEGPLFGIDPSTWPPLLDEGPHGLITQDSKFCLVKGSSWRDTKY